LGKHQERHQQGKRDSRDLEGWSRNDIYRQDRSGQQLQGGQRRDDALWDPKGKPPSGRPKSAIIPKSSLPPRFQRNSRYGDFPEDVPRDFVEEMRDSFPQDRDSFRSGETFTGVSLSARERSTRADSVESSVSVAERTNSHSHSGGKDASCVSDWSLEVEEEDERRSQAGTLERERNCDTPASLLSQGSNSRADSPDLQLGTQGGNTRGLIKLPESMTNPHWRPPPDSRNPHWRRDTDNWRSGSVGASAGYPAPGSYGGGWSSSAPTTPSGPYPPVPSTGIRFPLDPGSRFAAPAHLLAAQGFPGAGGGVPAQGGYRPPFPPRYPVGAPGPQSHGVPLTRLPVTTPPDWYDVYNPEIYGNSKTDITCITSIVRADMKLRSVLQGGPAIVCSRWDQEVRETRHQIMAAARYLMKNDLLFVAEHDVETHIWKTVYYQVVEILKLPYFDTENTTAENRATLKACLLNLFEEGADYYTQLLEDLVEVYRLDLELYYDPLHPREQGDRLGRLARVAAQKCNICLGDLARYREQVNSTTNYRAARQYYVKANHLEMRNGRPFNMLAILAKMNNRKFEAVYYHARCIASKNPFQSSREGLVSIFEEMKRRWDLGEKTRETHRLESEREREREGRRIVRGSKVRREVWEKAGPDSRRLHRTTSAQSSSSEGAEIAGLGVAELNKRFTMTLLHLLGKLYTQINTGDFSTAQSSLMDQFRLLISKSPLPLSTDRLVQIMALNMFTIEETKLRSQSGGDSTYRHVCQDLALSLAGDMFCLLLERANLLVAGSSPLAVLHPENQLDSDLASLLAPIKVWCDWLLGNNDTWYPLVSSEPFAQLAQLATRLEGIKQEVNEALGDSLSEESFMALPQARRDEFELIKLAEDSLLCDFSPWFRGLSWASYRAYCPRTRDLFVATSAKRVSQILLAVEYLEGLDQPVLKWSLPDNSHVCLVTEDGNSQQHFSRDIAVSNLTALIARDEYVLEESYSGEEEEGEDEVKEEERERPPSDTDSEIVQLRERREELQAKQRQERARARKAQHEILTEVVSLSLQVRPRLLVLDTNVLVDHLPRVQTLAKEGSLGLRVPQVVISELEGLAKGGQTASDRGPEHVAMVRDSSRAALSWLKDKPQNTKCVTSKGTTMPHFTSFQEEDTSDGQKNDDRILTCCLSLNTGPPPEVRQGMKTVYRDTVLITDDRNLKLKAHTSDCAVNTIKEFMAWFFPQEN